MKKIFAVMVSFSFPLLGSLLFFSSCATSVDAYYAAHAGDFTVKSIYLVVKSAESRDMDERIKRELNRRNVRVVMGPETKRVTTEDAIMKYTETFKTDITKNIDTFDVILFDKNGEVVATSHWKNSKVSLLASMSSVVTDTLEIIFDKVRVQP